MTTVDNIQYAFNAGEISPRVRARVDIDKYNAGLKECTNALVLPHGPAMRRSGLVYLGEVKDSDDSCRLIPFEFSEDQAYVIELGDQYARFWMDGGIIVTADSDTVLLLHFDGKQNSNSFDDDGYTGHTISAYGSAKQVITDYVFGSASLELDGDGDYLSIPDHADFAFGTDPFTIDLWFYSDSAVGQRMIYHQSNSGDVHDMIMFFIDMDLGAIHFYDTDGVGAPHHNHHFTYPAGFNADTWYHLALIRGWDSDDDKWMVCVNGVSCGTAITDSTTVNNFDEPILIGQAKYDAMLPNLGSKSVCVAYNTAKASTSYKKWGTGSVYFDGNSDFIAIPFNTDLNFSDGNAKTMEFWMKMDDHAGTEILFSMYEDDNNRFLMWHLHGAGIKYALVSGGVSVINSALFSHSEVTDTDWHHYAFYTDGAGNYGLYIDGCFRGKFTDASTDTLSSGAFVFGANYMVASSWTNFLDGFMDDIHYYDGNFYNLTVAEPFEDEGPSNHTVSISGDLYQSLAYQGIAHPISGEAAVVFPGSNEHCVISNHADFDFTDSMCIECWVHCASSGLNAHQIVGQKDIGGDYWSFYVGTYDVVFYYYTGGAIDMNCNTFDHVDSVTNSDENYAVPDDEWVHVAIIFDDNKMGIFINGKIQSMAYSVNDDNPSDWTDVATDVWIGEDNSGSRDMAGAMQNFHWLHTDPYGVDLTDWLTDEANGHVIIPYSNNNKKNGIQASSVIKKFGDASYWNADTSAHHARVADSTDFNIGDYTNYTLDLWVKHVDHAGTELYFGQYNSGDNDYWWLRHSHGNGVQFQMCVSGSVEINIAGGEITDQDWHHVAICKVGDDWGLYVDGDQVAFETYDSSGFDVDSQLFVAGYWVGMGGDSFYGWMDHMRMEAGNTFSAAPVVGLTDTITIPTAAPTANGDTKAIWNCDLSNATFTPPTTKSSADPTNTALLIHFDTPFDIPTGKISAGDSNSMILVRGDVMDFSGGMDEFRVSTKARWTADFSYPTSAYPGFQGGETYEISTPPWLDEELSELQFVQSADTLYVCHPDYNVYKITRTDHDNWTCVEIDWTNPPWWSNAVSNPDGVSLDPSNTTGNITVTADAPLFDSNWVDMYIKQTNGFYRITAVTDSQTASATVKSDLDNHNASDTWQKCAWNGVDGYPRCLTFHEDRLVLAGAGGEPLVVRLSESGDYENFEVDTDDDDPLSYEILAQKQNAILWVLGGNKLYIGTAGAEYLMTGESENTPITPTSILIRRQSTTGSEDHQPVTIGSALLYIQRDGRVINAWEYDYTTEVYTPVDLTILAEHVSKHYRFKEMQYSQDPNRIVWVRRADGAVVGLTIMKEQEVVGWHVHTTADSTDYGTVESMAVIPGDSQGRQQDELWLLVKRTIDGSDVRYIEMLDIVYDGDEIEYHRFSDSCLTYSGSPATVFSGADHLEGEAVVVLADGEWITGKTISSGGFTLTTAASDVTVGLAYNTTLELLTPELGQHVGQVTSSFKRKRFVKLLLMLYETCQLKCGKDTSNLFDVWDIAGWTDDTLYTENVEVEFDGNPEYDPTCVIQQQGPYGFTLLGIVETIDVED